MAMPPSSRTSTPAASPCSQIRRAAATISGSSVTCDVTSALISMTSVRELREHVAAAGGACGQRAHIGCRMSLSARGTAGLRHDRRTRAGAGRSGRHADRLRHDRTRARRPAAPGGGAAGVPGRAACARPALRSTSGSPTPRRWPASRWCRRGSTSTGRPQLIATRRGQRRRALRWCSTATSTWSPPSRVASGPATRSAPQLRDGKLYGRGACDMKGGIAAMMFAAELLAQLGVALRGDLLVATNTDEESSGAGGMALVRARPRGRRRDRDRADRLSHLGRLPWLGVRRDPRARPPRPRRGAPARLAPRRRRQRDREGRVSVLARDRLAAPRLGRSRTSTPTPTCRAPSLLATMARAGEWPVTYPASCELDDRGDVRRRPGRRAGWGSSVRREVEEWIARECAARR